MSIGDYAFTEAAREISKGLSNLGGSIEKSVYAYVEMRREQKEVGQEIAKEIAEGIKKLVVEIEAIRKEG